jgi:hypothetical protein
MKQRQKGRQKVRTPMSAKREAKREAKSADTYNLLACPLFAVVSMKKRQKGGKKCGHQSRQKTAQSADSDVSKNRGSSNPKRQKALKLQHPTCLGNGFDIHATLLLLFTTVRVGHGVPNRDLDSVCRHATASNVATSSHIMPPSVFAIEPRAWGHDEQRAAPTREEPPPY